MTFQEHMERAEFFLDEYEREVAAFKQWMADWRLRQQKKDNDPLDETKLVTRA